MMFQFLFKAFFEGIDIALQIITIVVTIFVAVYAFRISRGQLKLQKYQLKHDLYERRYKIYEELKNEYGDYGDAILIKELKIKKEGICSWLNKNEDHISFLFEDVVLAEANILKERLKNASREYFKVTPDSKVVKEVDVLYIDLKEKISNTLKLRNLD